MLSTDIQNTRFFSSNPCMDSKVLKNIVNYIEDVHFFPE